MDFKSKPYNLCLMPSIPKANIVDGISLFTLNIFNYLQPKLSLNLPTLMERYLLGFYWIADRKRGGMINRGSIILINFSYCLSWVGLTLGTDELLSRYSNNKFSYRYFYGW